MKQGKIYKNKQGRFQLEGSNYYWSSGDIMTIYDTEENTWVNGRVEHGEFDYYWTNGEYDVPLYNGLVVRIKD